MGRRGEEGWIESWRRALREVWFVPMKKYSRKEVAKMSPAAFAAAARGPYGKLWAYLRPYRSRFVLGIACGAVYGGLNGLLVYTVHGVSDKVLPPVEVVGRNGTTAAEVWREEREMPELRAALAAGALSEAEQAEALAAYEVFRKGLQERSLEAPQGNSLSKLVLPLSLPAEFRLTLEAERHLVAQPRELAQARAALQGVLALPEGARRHRTTWAHYLMAQCETERAAKGKAYAALQAASPEAGFSDVMGFGAMAPTVRPLGRIILVCASIPAIMLLRAIFGYLNSYCLVWVSLKLLDRIRGDLFAKILGQSQEFFNKQKGGDLLQTVMNQTRVAQQGFTGVISDLVKQPLSIVSAMAVLFYLDWKFTLMAMLLFPLCIIPVVLVSKKVRRAGADEEAEAGAMGVIMQEAFSGIRVVKAYGREAHEVSRFNASNQKMLRSMMRWNRALEGVGPLTEVVASLGVAAALVYVYSLGLPASSFIALNGGLVMLYPPAKALSRIPLILQKSLASTSKVFEMMERPSAVEDAPGAVAPRRGARGHLEFRGAGFSYRKDLTAISGIQLTIEPGETCALVGPSGAGKSTLFSLLLRFYDVQEGGVLLDGVDIRELPQGWLREQMGIVNQEVFLFHDTIYENIRYGRLAATREEIEQAARRAYAHDFIMAQPQGYDTVVGDKGCLLSGGQQQRLSIARAMLREAPILLLDEATSALDTESERKIQEALEDLSTGKTVIAIAHRLSTILKADKIVVMEEGRIVDVGRHGELLQSSALYRKLYSMQFHTELVALEPTAGTLG